MEIEKKLQEPFTVETFRFYGEKNLIKVQTPSNRTCNCATAIRKRQIAVYLESLIHIKEGEIFFL